MIKRMGAVAWWLAALSAGVLLAWAVLLFAWSVHKPWLPGGLDLRLRAVWFWDAVWSAAVSFLLALNLGAARRGLYRRDEGCGIIFATLGVLVLCVIIPPVATVRMEMYPTAGADFAGRNLQGADLHRLDNFGYANLRHADFSGADLRHAFFNGADLAGANFAGAELSHASFFHANATGANLTHADLRNAFADGAPKGRLAAQR